MWSITALSEHSGRFTIFQACALRDVRLTNTHIMVLAMMGQYANKQGFCWAKQKTMARQRGITQQSISKAIRALADFGYIKITRFKEPGATAVRNRYKILMDYELPEEFDRSLDSESEDDEPSEMEMEEAGMAPHAQPGVVRAHNPELYSAQPGVVPTNVPTTNVPPITIPLSLDIGSTLTSQAEKGLSLAPIADAFRVTNLKPPTFTKAEIGPAQLLLRLYDPLDIALCWQEIVTGLWGSQWDRDNLSFSLLSKNNRVANWKRQKEGTANVNGETSSRPGSSSKGGQGGANGNVGANIPRGPDDARFIRPRRNGQHS